MAAIKGKVHHKHIHFLSLKEIFDLTRCACFIIGISLLILLYLMNPLKL